MSENPLDRYLRAEAAPRRRHFLGPFVAVLGLALVLAGVLFATRWLDDTAFLQRQQCSVLLGSERYVLAPDQTRNGSIIAAAGLERGLDRHEVMIALATARQESKLRNIGYGDTVGPDSRGLFQQRPSQGWGTEEQIMDPWYAANRFYQELETVPGYRDLSVTEAAQAVQRSAYPDAYAKHEDVAAAFARALTEGEPGAMSCTLKATPADQAELSHKAYAAEMKRFADALSAEVQLKTDTRSLRISVPDDQTGWRLATWALANAEAGNVLSISFNSLHWERGKRSWNSTDEPTEELVITFVN
ncbi:hypothetical protein [Micrococcoides hystricis]|uniref:Heavy metal transporter n=1 Tax=Micrococcoides hystricis TaxID=1572761 RepID=A0ABV6P8E2_9MICC